MTGNRQNKAGVVLREARERRGLSLRQISASTKITVSTLKALEDEDFSRLPGGVFLRSFVRAYSLEVGVDPDSTLELFLAQCANNEEFYDSLLLHNLEDRGAFVSQQRIATTVASLVLISIPIVATLIFLGSRGERETLLAVNPIVDVMIKESGPEVFRENPPSEVGRFTHDTAAIMVAADDPLTIDIYPSAQCWVSLIVDGERVLSRVMQPGDRETYKAERDIIVTVGDAAAFDFSVNHKLGRVLGSSGEVVTAQISWDNYRSFVIP